MRSTFHLFRIREPYCLAPPKAVFPHGCPVRRRCFCSARYFSSDMNEHAAMRRLRHRTEETCLMAGRYNPKTLARTLTYVGYHSPAEFGLFWDPDGSMPWKEFYWALQEDPSLRFVREGHLKELAFLGIQIPFRVQAGFLRLKDEFPPPQYPSIPSPPERLFYPCRQRHSAFPREHGLSPTNRSFVPLFAEKDFAMAIGKRRHAEPIIVEVLSGKASARGFPVLQAGPALYLMYAVPPDCLVFPRLREDHPQDIHEKKQHNKKESSTKKEAQTPGSFILNISHLDELQRDRVSQKERSGKKRDKESDWKRASRKERNKRTL